MSDVVKMTKKRLWGMPKSKSNEKMVLISVHLPKAMLEEIDEMVSQGVFPSRSEAIRIALYNLIRQENRRKLPYILIPGR